MGTRSAQGMDEGIGLHRVPAVPATAIYWDLHSLNVRTWSRTAGYAGKSFDEPARHGAVAYAPGHEPPDTQESRLIERARQ